MDGINSDVRVEVNTYVEKMNSDSDDTHTHFNALKTTQIYRTCYFIAFSSY
jgi:hypothetical protein